VSIPFAGKEVAVMWTKVPTGKEDARFCCVPPDLYSSSLKLPPLILAIKPVADPSLSSSPVIELVWETVTESLVWSVSKYPKPYPGWTVDMSPLL